MPGPLDWWSASRPRRHPVREIVVSDAHVTYAEPQYLIAELEGVVVMLLQVGKFAREDLPRELLLAVAVSKYVGESQNGGHAQVVENTRADAVFFADVREGLATFGLEAVRDVWSRFEDFQ
jgi:hypothetical protein